MVYKCLHGLAPPYLVADCVLSDSRSKMSARLDGEPTSSICCVRLPRCHWDKNNTRQKELSSHWSNNLEQSSSRSATPLAVTAVIWTKTETVFVWVMSTPEEFCLSRAVQMFALLLLLLIENIHLHIGSSQRTCINIISHTAELFQWKLLVERPFFPV